MGVEIYYKVHFEVVFPNVYELQYGYKQMNEYPNRGGGHGQNFVVQKVVGVREGGGPCRRQQRIQVKADSRR